VLRPHIEIVFCEMSVSALCTAASQADGADPATPPVELVPALPPVSAGVSDVAGVPPLPLAPAVPPFAPAGSCNVGTARGPGSEPPELGVAAGVVTLLDAELATVTALPFGAERSGAISPTSPTASATRITNPRLWAKPTTLTASSPNAATRLETTTTRRRFDHRRASFEGCRVSTHDGDARPIPRAHAFPYKAAREISSNVRGSRCRIRNPPSGS